MQTLDTTIVNTTLPSMAHSFNESPLRMHYVIVSYVLTVAVMLPASGWLADRFGVKKVFFSAIVLFTVGSLLCVCATSLQELVLSRVMQGVGGAIMVPVGRLTVMKIVPRAQYMAAMAFVTLPGQIGPLVGPALGGFFGGICQLALDIPNQSAGWDHRRHGYLVADAELHYADPPFRFWRLPAAGAGNGDADAGP